MSAAHLPADESEVVDCIQRALAERAPLAIEGAGTKAAWGNAVCAAETLSLRALAGIEEYAPDELVVTCRPGTSLAALTDTLAGEGQRLPFAPPEWTNLRAGAVRNGSAAPSAASGPTVGGIVAANLSGPCRFRSGAARDYVLGVRGVSGRGEAFKAGGKVMKNVTGYDLSKLMTGSFGTLAVLTEVTLKVLPRAPAECTARVPLPSLADAADAMQKVLASPAEPCGLAYVPREAAAALSPGALAEAERGVLLLRFEGPAEGLAHRLELVRRLLPEAPPVRLADDEGPPLWRDLAELEPLVRGRPAGAIVKVSAAPAELPAFGAIAERRGARWFVDCGGHWLWMLVEDSGAAALVAALRNQAARRPAAVTLVRRPYFDSAGPAAGSGDTEPFTPLSSVAGRVQRQIKRGFDPAGILNPGRMYRDL